MNVLEPACASSPESGDGRDLSQTLIEFTFASQIYRRNGMVPEEGGKK